MKSRSSLFLACLLAGNAYPSVGQTIYDGRAVETPELRVELRPASETYFAIHFVDKVAGLQLDHRF